MKFKISDRVRYTGAFLRSIGAFTGEIGQQQGTITSVAPPYVNVLWDWTDESLRVREGVLIRVGAPDYS